MSSKRTPLTEDQKIFEIEERVYKLLSPELRIKYTAYRKVPVYPKEFRQPYGPRTTEYFDTTAERIATGFTLNNGSHLPTIKTIEIEEDLNTKNDNMNDIQWVKKLMQGIHFSWFL